MKRVTVYIDGFNLYHGLVAAGFRKYLWLDLSKLAKEILELDQVLTSVKYFTARTTLPNPAKQQRQNTYIDAVKTVVGVEVIEGRYQDETNICPGCGLNYAVPREKMTDINISVEMLSDAFRDQFVIAKLVSADSDLVPVVSMITGNFPQKRVVVAFPPNRYSTALVNVASSKFQINRAVVSRSQFPDKVIRQDGFILERPEKWT